VSAPAFELPAALEAHEPPEARGLARDDVRLMVTSRAGGATAHARFRDLPGFLAPGDLLVVNVSATLPSAITARRAGGNEVALHVSSLEPPVVELRTPDGARPVRGAEGEMLELDGGGRLELRAPYAGGTRLWLAAVRDGGTLARRLRRHGRPIRYGHVPEPWPLATYQTVFARVPGSAEMASAGRPFTPELVTRLVAGGVLVAPVLLHAGVSSPERHEPPLPERFEVPAATARLAGAVKGWGGRVIAVGTTVVRALESVASPDGTMAPGAGLTSLVVDAGRGLWAVDGLITGWHEPEASHLRLLEAAAGPAALARAYAEALAHGYLWHEFGDSHLIL
jgi:S-adenosylmethionine:tRNA ribosyltransferase-isomerase